jgi:hypothetical protein
MKDIKEIYVIYNPYEDMYYDGSSYSQILFAKQYHSKETAVADVTDIISNTYGVTYLEIEKLYTI